MLSLGTMDFNKTNKITSYVWLQTSVENIIIRIKVKPREGTVSFPKYNEHLNTSNKIQDSNQITEYTFKWQEKVFSRWEIETYSDKNNCITDIEKEYNDNILNKEYRASQMFTIINEFNTLADLGRENTTAKPFIDCFQSRLMINNEKTSSTRHLFKDEDKIEDNYRTMHVLWDNSEYNEESQVLYKEERVLLSLQHNPVTNCLVIFPSANDIEYNPYIVPTETGLLGFEYSVQIDDEEETMGDLVTLLNTLSNKLDKMQRSALSFVTPPTGTDRAVVYFEIVSAVNFEMDNIYIEFTAKIPEDIKYIGDVRGRTHVTKGVKNKALTEWKFGHCVEMQLEHADDLEPSVTVYFEVISTDWWGRHRTEGYCYVTVSSAPGRYSRSLSCRRPEELDRTEAESRRYFVGGCHLIKDINLLNHPQDFDTNFRFVSTGDILVQWHTVRQAPSAEWPPARGPSSHALQGADHVLRQYKKAKETLAAATRDLDIIQHAEEIQD